MNPSIRIDILNPKALELLNALANMKMISIQENTETGFELVLKKLRSKAKNAPSLEEITAEVEEVRARRHAK